MCVCTLVCRRERRSLTVTVPLCSGQYRIWWWWGCQWSGKLCPCGVLFFPGAGHHHSLHHHNYSGTERETERKWEIQLSKTLLLQHGCTAGAVSKLVDIRSLEFNKNKIGQEKKLDDFLISLPTLVRMPMSYLVLYRLGHGPGPGTKPRLYSMHLCTTLVYWYRLKLHFVFTLVSVNQSSAGVHSEDASLTPDSLLRSTPQTGSTMFFSRPADCSAQYITFISEDLKRAAPCSRFEDT